MSHGPDCTCRRCRAATARLYRDATRQKRRGCLAAPIILILAATVEHFPRSGPGDTAQLRPDTRAVPHPPRLHPPAGAAGPHVQTWPRLEGPSLAWTTPWPAVSGRSRRATRGLP